MKTNKEYKNAALAALKGNWAPFVVAVIIMMAFMYVIMGPYLFVYQVSLGMNQIVISPAFALAAVALYILGMPLLTMPLTLGFDYASNRLLVEGDNRAVGNLFRDSFGRWGRKVWGMFLMNFFISLWSLLLIIPGFIKFYAYALTPYILIDNPELSANQAINLSQKMMKGHKFDMFILHLSFIGWIFLSIFTFGIGLLWLLPYMMTAQAAFYQDVKKEFNK
jgi:uncharacterized membrane protein